MLRVAALVVLIPVAAWLLALPASNRYLVRTGRAAPPLVRPASPRRLHVLPIANCLENAGYKVVRCDRREYTSWGDSHDLRRVPRRLRRSVRWRTVQQRYLV